MEHFNSKSHPQLKNKSIFKLHNCKKESFIYSLLAALYSTKLSNNVFHDPKQYKKYKSNLNLHGNKISFHIKVNQIKQFVHQNQNLNIKIKLFEATKISNDEIYIHDTHIEHGKGKMWFAFFSTKVCFPIKRYFICIIGLKILMQLKIIVQKNVQFV